jgi:predicted O-methyltransferase YrrM
MHTRHMIDRLIRDGTTVAADGTTHTLSPVAISADEGEALKRWVVREKATSTIEVGLGYAISGLYILEGLISNGGDVRHVAMDPNQGTRFGNCGLLAIEEAGATRLLEFHADESQVVLPRLLGEGRTFDLAFVDGNHRFDGVFVDLAYLGRLVKRGGIIFVDDYQLPGIARAVSFFVKNLGWVVEEVSDEEDLHHWVVLRTATAPDTRPFTHFVEF